jgi:PTH1 family peptidyl-tRNA hydrolase
MNRSGESVRDASEFYKIPHENIVILCDDINLDIGKLRIRRKGSDGGQKGLRDVIYQLSDDGVPRIRMGVGKVPKGGDVVNWVLGKIPEGDREEFYEVLGRVADAVPLVIEGRIDEAMCKYN